MGDTVFTLTLGVWHIPSWKLEYSSLLGTVNFSRRYIIFDRILVGLESVVLDTTSKGGVYHKTKSIHDFPSITKWEPLYYKPLNCRNLYNKDTILCHTVVY